MLKLIDDSILEFQEEMLVSVDHRVCYIYFIYVKLGWQYFIFGSPGPLIKTEVRTVG